MNWVWGEKALTHTCMVTFGIEDEWTWWRSEMCVCMSVSNAGLNLHKQFAHSADKMHPILAKVEEPKSDCVLHITVWDNVWSLDSESWI